MLLHKQNYTSLALDSFVLRLHEIGAIKIDTRMGFRLKLHETNPNAPLSPLYFNLRIADNKHGPLSYTELQTMADFMAVYLYCNEIKFDGICGIPRAGEPIAEEIQKILFNTYKRTVPRVVLDKYEGDQVRRIGSVRDTGELAPGSKVLLVDDLITKADSKVEATERLRESGYKVEQCIVFLDREQGGRRQLGLEMGVDVNFIVTLSAVLLILRDSKRISGDEYAHIQAYIKNSQ